MSLAPFLAPLPPEDKQTFTPGRGILREGPSPAVLICPPTEPPEDGLTFTPGRGILREGLSPLGEGLSPALLFSHQPAVLGDVLGSCLALAWLLLGSFLALAWLLLGSCLALAWRGAYGQYDTSIQVGTVQGKHAISRAWHGHGGRVKTSGRRHLRLYREIFSGALQWGAPVGHSSGALQWGAPVGRDFTNTQWGQ